MLVGNLRMCVIISFDFTYRLISLLLLFYFIVFGNLSLVSNLSQCFDAVGCVRGKGFNLHSTCKISRSCNTEVFFRSPTGNQPNLKYSLCVFSENEPVKHKALILLYNNTVVILVLLVLVVLVVLVLVLVVVAAATAVAVVHTRLRNDL